MGCTMVSSSPGTVDAVQNEQIRRQKAAVFAGACQVVDHRVVNHHISCDVAVGRGGHKYHRPLLDLSKPGPMVYVSQVEYFSVHTSSSLATSVRSAVSSSSLLKVGHGFVDAFDRLVCINLSD